MPKKSNRPDAISPLSPALDSRQQAVTALEMVLFKSRPLDEALKPIHTPQHEQYRFVEHLVRGALKHKLTLEHQLQQHLTKPFCKLPPKAQLLFVLGAVQLQYMAVPAYAAVNTSVELAKHYRLKSLSGVINAVLKKLGKQQTAPPTALLQLMPDWIQQRLTNDYQQEAEAIIAASLSDSVPIDITIKEYDNIPHWEHLLGGSHIGGHSIRLMSPPSINTLPGYAEGKWWVQDLAASYPLTALQHKLKGARVLDACAAPGGKTMQLAHYGAHVTALDRSKSRLKRLEENLKRTSLHADIVHADLFDYQPSALFDVIILDAPCSATGTLRRNPDILYMRSDNDVKDVTSLQGELINLVTPWIKPNGLLLYCSCSLFKEEGEFHRQTAEQYGLSLVPFPSSDHSPMTQTNPPYYRALPHHYGSQGGVDGFFAALFQRTNS